MHQVIKETQGLCPMCGGTGQVRQYNGDLDYAHWLYDHCTAMYTTCGRCGGRGLIVTSCTTYRIVPDPGDDLAEADYIERQAAPCRRCGSPDLFCDCEVRGEAGSPEGDPKE